MKAHIVNKDGNIPSYIVLTPETDADKESLGNFGAALKRPHTISCRGFDYLAPEVCFLIQPTSSRD